MSLLDSYTGLFVKLEAQKVSDGEGGTRTTWIEGGTFVAAVTLDAANAEEKAERENAANVYTITTKKNVLLGFHEVIKRTSDGKAFLIVSDGADNKTPDSACLNMRQVKAEEWRLT
jgi:hypothetical protein